MRRSPICTPHTPQNPLYPLLLHLIGWKLHPCRCSGHVWTPTPLPPHVQSHWLCLENVSRTISHLLRGLHPGQATTICCVARGSHLLIVPPVSTLASYSLPFTPLNSTLVTLLSLALNHTSHFVVPQTRLTYSCLRISLPRGDISMVPSLCSGLCSDVLF